MKIYSITTTVAVLFLNLILLGGCRSSPLSGSPDSQLVIRDTLGNMPTYPCVNLGIVASTPSHLWQDPCCSEYKYYRVSGVQLLTKPGEVATWAKFKNGEAFGYIMKHEKGFNILFSPRYNLQKVDDLSFDSNYKRLEKENANLNKLFCSMEAKHKFFRQDNSLVISLIPLTSVTSEQGKKRYINYTMLSFLLELKGVWRDLMQRYEKGEDREAIELICLTVAEVMSNMESIKRKALVEKYNTIITWCLNHSSQTKSPINNK